MVDIDKIKKIRELTGISVSECRKALETTNGDIEKAKEILRKWGKDFVGKRAGRETGQGIIDTYLHPNKKVGVMLELRCESDFVARSDDFQKLAHELCLQIAAMQPRFIKNEDIPRDLLKKEREIYKEQLKDSKKPPKIIDQITEGKIKKFVQSITLMSQPWIRDESKTIADLLSEFISKLGENILIKKFIRFEINS